MAELVFVAVIAFLIGFKIAAWMGKRHAERITEVYRVSSREPNSGNPK